MDVIDTLMIYGQDQLDFSGGMHTTTIRTPRLRNPCLFVAKKENEDNLLDQCSNCSHTVFFSSWWQEEELTRYLLKNVNTVKKVKMHKWLDKKLNI